MVVFGVISCYSVMGYFVLFPVLRVYAEVGLREFYFGCMFACLLCFICLGFYRL